MTNTNRHLFKNKINGDGKIQTRVFPVEKQGFTKGLQNFYVHKSKILK